MPYDNKKSRKAVVICGSDLQFSNGQLKSTWKDVRINLTLEQKESLIDVKRAYNWTRKLRFDVSDTDAILHLYDEDDAYDLRDLCAKFVEDMAPSDQHLFISEVVDLLTNELSRYELLEDY